MWLYSSSTKKIKWILRMSNFMKLKNRLWKYFACLIWKLLGGFVGKIVCMLLSFQSYRRHLFYIVVNFTCMFTVGQIKMVSYASRYFTVLGWGNHLEAFLFLAITWGGEHIPPSWLIVVFSHWPSLSLYNTFVLDLMKDKWESKYCDIVNFIS